MLHLIPKCWIQSLSLLYICHGMLLNSLYLWLTLLHQALVTESRRTWQPSPTSLGIRGLCPQRPQRRIECSKQRCQLRDVKCITASCRSDIMISYKSSCPVGTRGLFSCSVADCQLYRQPPLSNRALFWNHSRGSHCFLELNLCLGCLSNSVGSTVHSALCQLVRTVPTAFSILY